MLRLINNKEKIYENKIYKETEGVQYDKGPTDTETDKIKRLELQVKYIEKENYFLAKLRTKREERNSGLKKNAYKYGFVMSYPEDKIKITGYIYEPWHYRFVGVRAAKEIFKKKISIEEYFDDL